jgi:penicillin-binding protein 1A
MTDLLQSAVLSGTGRAAQIGRPVAGKTGTTSSNKDGWFIGFSSGLTAAVWMGRDDARPVAGLQGGTAPARAFHDFMSLAVANRPVEQFDTQVPLPDWQLSPEEEYADDGAYDTNSMAPLVDENGMPIGLPPGDQPIGQQVDPYASGDSAEQGPSTDPTRYPQRQPQPQPQRPPESRLAPPAQPPEPRSLTL